MKDDLWYAVPPSRSVSAVIEGPHIGSVCSGVAWEAISELR
jgi:hypothetical protein